MILFFLASLTSEHEKKAPHKCLRRLTHNLKKNPEHGYLHLFYRLQILFFLFRACIFWGVIRWNRLTILFFFGFFDVQTWKTVPHKCLRWLAHNFKKPQTWVLEHVWRLQILFFFLISCLFFEVLFGGTGWRYYFFWLLWRPDMKKAPHECLRRLAHNFKKTPNMGTWTFFTGSKSFFLNFVLVFWGVIRWNRLTILFFLASLTSKHVKKCPPNVLGDSRII